jgi:PKD repeat protein
LRKRQSALQFFIDLVVKQLINSCHDKKKFTYLHSISQAFLFVFAATNKAEASVCDPAFLHSTASTSDSVFFYHTGSSVGQYLWTFGDGDSSNALDPMHVYPGPGSYTVCLFIRTLHDSCIWCDTIMVGQDPPCAATFTYSISGNSDSVHFQPDTTNAVSYLWTFGDGDSSTQQSPWHEYSGSGTYTVCLYMITLHDTCHWCHPVVINDSMHCYTQFNYYALNNPDSIHFYPTGNAATSYYWDFGDGNYSTLQYPWHYYALPGTYNVCLTTIHGSDTCTWCHHITIHAAANCNAEFSYYTQTSHDSVHFHPLHTGATSWYWNFGDGDSSNSQFPWHIFPSDGVYYVCLTVQYSSDTCTWCDSVLIDSSNVFHRMANNTALDDFYFFDISTAIGGVSNLSQDIIFYPNPFSNKLIIKRNGRRETEGEVSLYDITGKEILRRETSGEETTLNTENIAAGFYLLRVGGENYKVVKRN